MKKVIAKKHLGQHFLLDLNIAKSIVDLVPKTEGIQGILEIGPGMGVLTQYMVQRPDFYNKLVEIDTESVEYLRENFSFKEEDIISDDFLKLNLIDIFPDFKTYTIIGNFPYNISSQIFFSVLDFKDTIHQVVCMLQKEVGARIASKPGNKDYGILSVFLQAYYDITYEFSIGPHVFDPPPKVDSCVIKLVRNLDKGLSCDFDKFKIVVKTAFNQRRKMLSNALGPITQDKTLPFLTKRAEQLSYLEFEELTNLIFPKK